MILKMCDLEYIIVFRVITMEGIMGINKFKFVESSPKHLNNNIILS